MYISKLKKGFSLAEIIVVLAIMGIISAIALSSFSSLRSKKQIETTIDSISFKLEQAKSSALSGKDAKKYGLYFTNTSYTFFSGDSYNSNDPSNASTTIASSLGLNYVLSDGGDTVLFSRITGYPQATGTITLMDSNSPNTASILIGPLGDINVIK